MALLRGRSPLVQQNSVDEAALQWDEHGFEPGPAMALRAHVREQIGISVSLGLARNPLVAKMASERAKDRVRSFDGELWLVWDEAAPTERLVRLPIHFAPGVSEIDFTVRGREASSGKEIATALR